MLDIIPRRGWKLMMAVVIPVYVINALYLWPITLWTYLRSGRPNPLGQAPKKSPATNTNPLLVRKLSPLIRGVRNTAMKATQFIPIHQEIMNTQHTRTAVTTGQCLFAAITVAVGHCGAGCVLGDIIGEWLVYGINTTINGRMLWPEVVVDYDDDDDGHVLVDDADQHVLGSLDGLSH